MDDGIAHTFVSRARVVLEPVEGDFSLLADLDAVAIGITQVAAPFPAAIVQWLAKKERPVVDKLGCGRKRLPFKRSVSSVGYPITSS